VALQQEPRRAAAVVASVLKPIQFLAIMFTALALVPGGAHLFALPNKIALAQDEYFIVQNIYRGWALFGFILFPALLLNLLLAWIQRNHTAPSLLAGLAALCLAATLVIFFLWTYPANVATSNWTSVPANWPSLRQQWEYSHAVTALCTFAGLCAVVLSVLIRQE
jgi:hypothetical protein